MAATHLSLQNIMMLTGSHFCQGLTVTHRLPGHVLSTWMVNTGAFIFYRKILMMIILKIHMA